MFGFIMKIFIGLLSGLECVSKCVYLTNQKCTTQPTLINLHPNEYSQEFHYYPFAVNLSNKVCFQTKQKI